MFEAKLAEGNILKKIVEAIKDVVTDVNIDVSPAGKFYRSASLIYRSAFRRPIRSSLISF